ncbi:MAG: hypothetical protein IGR92_08020, partial [Leptolyngbyaceae cyanobacterium T60_A2020_046]|nr:hypothetical protein [Leptolyngbyaceae cyanobacterium T60_A2020_046]
MTEFHLNEAQRSLMAEALYLARFLIGQGAEHADPSLVQRRRDRIREIQHALQTQTHPVHRDARPVSAIPLAVRRAFVQALMLVSRYFTVGGLGWRGTLRSPTLSQYCPDPVPPDWHTPDRLLKLCDRFQLGDDCHDTLRHHLSDVDADIAVQRRLIAAVLDTVHLTVEGDAVPPREAFAALFQVLFGGILLNPDKLDGLFTPTQIYFCVDFPTGDRAEDWQALSVPEHQSRLRDLHHQIQTFNFSKFRRFPTFGPCDPATIDGRWVRQVCDRTGLSASEVREMLSKSVGVLPRADAEMVLIHDIWGPYWQLRFSQFESDYASLSDCDEPLRAGETAYTETGPLTCRELFQLQGDTVTL